MSLAPGTRLGPYEIVGHIGSGGMGACGRGTWQSHTTVLSDIVLIKEVK